tara:strand:+ start:106 stop:651 length:546 start_codon:yes stop_codon:yes gene_type:complete
MFQNTKPTKKHDPKVFQEYFREVPTGKKKKELNDLKAELKGVSGELLEVEEELKNVKAELKGVKAELKGVSGELQKKVEELEKSREISRKNVANKIFERKESDREAGELRNDREQLMKTLKSVKDKIENIKTPDEDSNKKLDNIWNNIEVALDKSEKMEKDQKARAGSKKKKKKSRRRKKK